MWSAIDSEEAIGRVLWQRYNSSGIASDKIPRLTFGTWARTASLAIPLYESDLKVYRMAMSNNECFTAKASADIRNANQNAGEWLGGLKRTLPIAQRTPERILLDRSTWVHAYPSYWSLHNYN